MADYERGRPDAGVACRAGHERVLRDGSFVLDPKPVAAEEGRLSVRVDHRVPG
jgi:hypothetical protein